MQNPEPNKMTAMHFFGWEKGLKTGQYYLRSRPARDAIKFTVNVEALLQAADSKNPDEILTALDKVKEAKPGAQAVNLGKPRTAAGLPSSEPAAKKQKVEEEEEEDPFQCLNCGS